MAMRYLNSVIAGIVAAVGASVIWVLVVFILPVLLPLFILRLSGSGSSASGAYISSESIFGVALIGFLVGFVWSLRRTSRIYGFRK